MAIPGRELLTSCRAGCRTFWIIITRRQKNEVRAAGQLAREVGFQAGQHGGTLAGVQGVQSSRLARASGSNAALCGLQEETALCAGHWRRRRGRDVSAGFAFDG